MRITEILVRILWLGGRVVDDSELEMDVLEPGALICHSII